MKITKEYYEQWITELVEAMGITPEEARQFLNEELEERSITVL